jgi:hypothetical protein
MRFKCFVFSWLSYAVVVTVSFNVGLLKLFLIPRFQQLLPPERGGFIKHLALMIISLNP